MNSKSRWQLALSLITCLLIMISISVIRSQKIFGHEFSQQPETEFNEPQRTLNDGTVVISTHDMTKDIMGYAGPIPLEIEIKDGIITSIKAMRNSETPSFLRRVEQSQVFKQWIGLNIEEALKTKVDAVSGATLSSEAVITGIQRGLQYAQSAQVDKVHSINKLFNIKTISALMVVLLAAILPLFIRSSRYRTIQLILNIVVLGFWSGSFISYSLMMNYLSNGVQIWGAIVPLIMLFVVVVYPLFGKSNYYCNWICPLGSLQELVGKCTSKKYNPSPFWYKTLNYFRQGLWALLMIFMWCGVLFSWMDYELFTAFMFEQASWIVLSLATLFVALSLFVGRPYCRFVCPTGSLFKIYQKNK